MEPKIKRGRLPGPLTYGSIPLERELHRQTHAARRLEDERLAVLAVATNRVAVQALPVFCQQCLRVVRDVQTTK